MERSFAMHVRLVSVAALGGLATTALVALCAGGVAGSPAAHAAATQNVTAQRLSPLAGRLPSLLQPFTSARQPARQGSWDSPGAGTKQHVYVVDPSLNGYYGAVCY